MNGETGSQVAIQNENNKKSNILDLLLKYAALPAAWAYLMGFTAQASRLYAYSKFSLIDMSWVNSKLVLDGGTILGLILLPVFYRYIDHSHVIPDLRRTSKGENRIAASYVLAWGIPACFVFDLSRDFYMRWPIAIGVLFAFGMAGTLILYSLRNISATSLERQAATILICICYSIFVAGALGYATSYEKSKKPEKARFLLAPETVMGLKGLGVAMEPSSGLTAPVQLLFTDDNWYYIRPDNGTRVLQIAKNKVLAVNF